MSADLQMYPAVQRDGKPHQLSFTRDPALGQMSDWVSVEGAPFGNSRTFSDVCQCPCLTAGLREGEEISPAAAYMLTPIVASAFGSTADVKEVVSGSIDSRSSRKEAYKV